MTAWKHSGSITLEKNDQYWDKDKVKLKKIDMVMINNNNTELKNSKLANLIGPVCRSDSFRQNPCRP